MRCVFAFEGEPVLLIIWRYEWLAMVLLCAVRAVLTLRAALQIRQHIPQSRGCLGQMTALTVPKSVKRATLSHSGPFYGSSRCSTPRLLHQKGSLDTHLRVTHRICLINWGDCTRSFNSEGSANSPPTHRRRRVTSLKIEGSKAVRSFLHVRPALIRSSFTGCSCFVRSHSK